MRYKLLGRSGLRVSELALGAMTFGEDWGFGSALDECKRMVDVFRERGGNFIDTAINYTNGSSEAMVGELTAGDRDRWVLATKYTLSTRPDDPNASGNHRKNLVQSVEKSLRRLRSDRIDLLWVHAWDEITPPEEVMRALDDVVRAGKVLYLGVSDTPAWVIAQENTLAELRGWSRFVGLQLEYSLIERTPERDLLPMARALDMGVTAWGSLGGGVLSGKYNGGKAEDSRRAEFNRGRLGERTDAIVAEVTAIAHELARSPAQVALAWLRAQPGVIMPILGARKLSQLEDNLGVLDTTLAPEQLEHLDKVSAIRMGFPHEMLREPFVRSLIYGNSFESLDSHRK
jgi:aryl-alcohol dehydrogenase-like predicted oxidoreductase